MNKIKVMSIFGTRPEAIKMAPLVKFLERDERFQSIVCVTAQHREMLDSVMRIFDIKPDYDLNIMNHGQSIIDISNRVLKGVSDVLNKSKPDIVLVHGDTTTTLNSALAAFYNKIPVAHVEAGLRSYNNYSPFPEEINRKITTSIAEIHFAPTKNNKKNLLKEGISDEKIFITGNTVIDALRCVIKEDYVFEENLLNNIDFNNKKVILLTTHRRENWGKPMENIFKAVIEFLNSNKDIEVVFPMHKNPKIRELAVKYFNEYLDRIHLIDPLEYVDFTNLMNKVYLIMTDSGGIQEEAPSLGKPVLVLRTETERPEALEAGTVKLVGISKEVIVTEVNKIIRDRESYELMSKAVNPYGDGLTSQRVASIIENYFNEASNCIDEFNDL